MKKSVFFGLFSCEFPEFYGVVKKNTNCFAEVCGQGNGPPPLGTCLKKGSVFKPFLGHMSVSVYRYVLSRGYPVAVYRKL